jgi:hypothetical protein
MKKRSFKDSDAILYSLSLLASISTMIFAQLFLLYIAYFEIIDKHNEILDAIPIYMVIIILCKMMALHHFFFKKEAFKRKFTKIEKVKIIADYSIITSVIFIAINLIFVFMMMVILAFMF